MDILRGLSSVHIHSLLLPTGGCLLRLKFFRVEMRTRTKHLLEMLERGNYACWCLGVRVGRMRFYPHNHNISYPSSHALVGRRDLRLGAFRSGNLNPGLCTCARRTSVRNMVEMVVNRKVERPIRAEPLGSFHRRHNQKNRTACYTEQDCFFRTEFERYT